jgi:hypothetical protein
MKPLMSFLTLPVRQKTLSLKPMNPIPELFAHASPSATALADVSAVPSSATHGSRYLIELLAERNGCLIEETSGLSIQVDDSVSGAWVKTYVPTMVMVVQSDWPSKPRNSWEDSSTTIPSAAAIVSRTKVPQVSGTVPTPLSPKRALDTPFVSDWKRLIADLDRWENLPDDWDGESGVAPSKNAVAAAKALLKLLWRKAIPLPEGHVAGDGEIGFTWKKGSAYASTAIFPDLHLVAYLDDGKGSPILRIDEVFSADIDLSSFVSGLRGFF